MERKRQTQEIFGRWTPTDVRFSAVGVGGEIEDDPKAETAKSCKISVTEEFPSWHSGNESN